ncbi:MAG: hypothetical protein QOD29_2142, partial [Alphaproteobacteria bacterium]|nr:hypothetical protein [Alphaproteobacteria bacterium]
MRRAWLSATAISVLHICVAASGRAWGADDPYQSKTLNLRSGPITLEPTQSAVPIQAPLNSPSPAGSPSPAALPNTGARWITAPPISSNEAVPAQREVISRSSQEASGPPRPAARPIGSEHAILNFERRVTASEREALQRNGIEIGEYLGGTAYTARIRQSETDALVDASKGINTVQHVVAFDERNAHIKVDPSLTQALQSVRNQPASAEAAQPLPNIIVEAWPEADFEQVKQQLQARGTIKRVSAATRKIEMSVENADAVRAISTLKDIKYIAPSFEIKAQNTHVRRNVGADLAIAAPHFLSGNNVRVGVWDEGHVAASHPSFTGRLLFDLERDGFAAPKTARHSTHVAGIIAGSGEYAAPVIASDGGARMTEGQFPAFGKAQSPTLPPDSAPAEAPVASEEASNQAEPSYPGIAVNATIMSFEFNQATDKLISLLTDKPDAIDVMNNSWNIGLTQANCAQLASYGLLGGPEFDAVVSGEINGRPVRR